MSWVPPRSPYSLIQEDLWPDRWLILVSCMMLNCTSRKQVEKVLPEFKRRWPTPQAFLAANDADVVELCRPLGFANRRTTNLKKRTVRYLAGPWTDPRELPGVGEYGARAYEIFCLGVLGDAPPKDHALVQYWHWVVGLADDALVAQEVADRVVVHEEADVGSLAQPGRDAEQLAVEVPTPAA